MASKKSQIMLFLILGVLILFILAAIYVTLININKGKIKPEKVSETIKESNSFKNYAISCLEQETKNALYLAGRQGGVIYDTQVRGGKTFLGPYVKPYGEHILPLVEDDIIYNVSYGIVLSKNDQHHPKTPLYPYGITPLVSNPDVQFDPNFIGVYGNFPNNPITPLCDYNGGNDPRQEGMKQSCETYDSKQKFIHASLQEYLEYYITKKSISCIKDYSLEKINFENLSYEKANTTLVFSNDDVHATLNLPLEFNIGGKDSTSKHNIFKVVVKNRIKLIHELVSHLVDRDTNDIFFDIVNDAGSLVNCKAWPGYTTKCLKEGMNVTKIKNPCQANEVNCPYRGNYDDILVVTDNDYSIDGKPFEFHVAIMNRPPALDLIYQTEGTLGFGYDVVTYVGDKIAIDPFGFDPDEDYHGSRGFMGRSYNYYLWKETYDATYNAVFCEHPDSASECTKDPYKASYNLFDVKPRAWTISEDYNKTLRNASYQTETYDKGAHNVKVEVCDEEGLCDYQVLRIFIGYAGENMSTNFYGDIPNKYASLEDPYRLVFPEITLFAMPELYEFFLYDDLGNLLFKTNQTENYFQVPQEYFISFPFEVPEIPSVGDYRVRFRAYDKYGKLIWDSIETGSDMELEVKECLPHRNEDEQPYPFHTEDSDLLQADHTCCAGDPNYPDDPNFGTLLGNQHICYSFSEYGCIDYDNFTEIDHVASHDTTVYHNLDVSEKNRENDVYQRNVKVRCSGGSGNSCTGPVDEVFTWARSCGECQTCSYDKDRAICVSIDHNPYHICNSTFACSAGPSTPYNEDSQGGYLCQATCYYGRCVESTNCSCSADCGAECTKGDYTWEGNSCSLCNETGGCRYTENNMICPAPDITDGYDFSDNYDLEYDVGTINLLLRGDYNVNSTFNSISGSEYNFASTCKYNVAGKDWCVTSVCGSDGKTNFYNDHYPCLESGQFASYCYVTTEESYCLVNGTCSNARKKPKPEDPNLCFKDFVCNPENDVGWTYTQETKPSSSYYYDSEDDSCNYDYSCTAYGWVTTSKDPRPSVSCGSGSTMVCKEEGWVCEV